MSDIWEVQYFGYERDYEISVIKKGNKLGHESWGWGGKDKIIIFDNQTCNTYGLDIFNEGFMLSVANKFCDALNNG